MARDLYPRLTGNWSANGTFSQQAVGANRLGDGGATTEPVAGDTVHLDDEMGAGAVDITVTGTDAACLAVLGTVVQGEASDFTGDLLVDGQTLEIDTGGLYLATGAELSGSGTLSITGDCDLTGVTYSSWTGILVMVGTGILTGDSSALGGEVRVGWMLGEVTTLGGNLICRKLATGGGTLTGFAVAIYYVANDPLSVDPTGTIDSDIYLYNSGTFTQSAITMGGGAGSINLRGADGQLLSASGAWEFGPHALNVFSSTTAESCTIDMDTHDLACGVLTLGQAANDRPAIFNCGTGIIDIGNEISAVGNSNSTFNAEDATVNVTVDIHGDDLIVTADSGTITVTGDVILSDGSLTLGAGSTLDVAGELTGAAGAAISGVGDIEVGSTVSIADVDNTSWTGKLTLNGSTSADIWVPSASGLKGFEIANSAGTKTLKVNVTVNTGYHFTFSGAGNMALDPSRHLYCYGNVLRTGAGLYSFGVGASIRCLGNGDLGGWDSNVANSYFHVAQNGATTTVTGNVFTRQVHFGSGVLQLSSTLYAWAFDNDAITSEDGVTINGGAMHIYITNAPYTQKGMTFTGGSSDIYLRTGNTSSLTATGHWNFGGHDIKVYASGTGHVSTIDMDAYDFTSGDFTMGDTTFDRPGIFHSGSGTINIAGNVANNNTAIESTLDVETAAINVAGNLTADGIKITGSGTLTVTGNCNLVDADYTTDWSGDLVMDGSATLTGDAAIIGGLVTVAATSQITTLGSGLLCRKLAVGKGTLNSYYAAIYVNDNDPLTVDADGTVNSDIYLYNSGTYTQGAIDMIGGEATVHMVGQTSNLFIASGDWDFGSHPINLYANAEGQSNEVDTAGFDLDCGDLTFGKAIDRPGVLSCSSSTVNVDGDVSAIGTAYSTLNIEDGDFNIDGDLYLEYLTVTFGEGTISVSGSTYGGSGNPGRLPRQLSIIVCEPSNEPPSGMWADYNTRYKWWRETHRTFYTKDKLVHQADLPEKPDVDDYPDLTHPPTIPPI